VAVVVERASARSYFAVLRKNGDESSLSRKMPREWFFCESIPAVRTTPQPSRWRSDGSF